MAQDRATRLLNRLLICVVLANMAMQAHAENLVSLTSGSLPALAGKTSAIFVASDLPVIVKGNTLWHLEGTQWLELDWRPSGRIYGAIQDGTRPYLLIETQDGHGIDRVEKFPDAAALRETALPQLPVPLARARGAMLGGTLYLAGVAMDGTAHWLSFDVKAPQPGWKTLTPWSPGSSGIAAVVAQDSALYVVARQAGSKGDQFWSWTSSQGWSEKPTLSGVVVEGAARAIGQAHILMLLRQDANVPASARSQFITYHTTTGAFANQGTAFPEEARHGIGWRNGMVWEHAIEDSMSTKFSLSEIEESKLLLRPLDWTMIVIYLVAIASIGGYCYWREEKQSTAEFFVGSRTIPFWAAAVSLYVTNTSSIGYIAITAKAFATNWQYLVNNLITVFGLMFVATWIVPLLRRLRLVSVFDYLEQRFHPSVRMMASAMCIMLHLGGRMSIILFLPALAIATITGFDMVWSILIIGLVTMGYTALGGMRAVIWTDFLQLIVKVGGLVFALVFILLKLDVGMGEIVATAEAADKMKMFDWSFDLTKATVWGFLFIVLMDTVLTFPRDQVLMQRVFTTKSDRDAGRSVWLYAAIVLPAGWLFYAIGTGLWVFYLNHPERMNPLLSVDATFPLFIAAELPAGITGLMIAGIFASSMATCASIMNSVATMVSVDFYERLAKHPTQRTSIRLAEFVTVLAGLIGIGLALLLSRYTIGSYIDVALELWGLLGGGFGGAYTLGMFTRRANWQGVLIGMAASVVLTFAAWMVNLVHPFIYLGIAVLSSIVFGYLGSLFFPPPDPDSLKGLVIER
ncbi:MAG: sodium:solute symporter [Rhodocyclaceae bacterium]|nr:MAG: sodium:solute symporter [Rhodocyclaceae bacterium]